MYCLGQFRFESLELKLRPLFGGRGAKTGPPVPTFTNFFGWEGSGPYSNRRPEKVGTLRRT